MKHTVRGWRLMVAVVISLLRSQAAQLKHTVRGWRRTAGDLTAPERGRHN